MVPPLPEPTAPVPLSRTRNIHGRIGREEAGSASNTRDAAVIFSVQREFANPSKLLRLPRQFMPGFRRWGGQGMTQTGEVGW